MRQDDGTALRKLTAEMLAKYADSEAVVRAAREPLYAALNALNRRVGRIEDALAAAQEPPLTFAKFCRDHSTSNGTTPS